MITALIPLPNFLLPPSISDTTIINSPSNIEYETEVASYSRGRSIYINRSPVFYKYKIILSEVIPELQNTKEFLHNPSQFVSESEVVFISTTPIDLDTYETNPYGVIYPLYGKTGGITVVFPKSIERFLKLANFYDDTELMSPIDFIEEQQALYGGLFPAEQEFLSSIAPLAWGIGLQEAAGIIQTDRQQVDALIAKSAYHYSIFPRMFLLASNAVSWQELKMYVNGFADKTNNVRNGVVGSMIRWEELYNHLVYNGRILTRPYYFDARMDLVVYYAHLIGDDFVATVDMSNDHFDIPDMYLNRIQLDGQFEMFGSQRSGHIKEFVRALCKAVDNPWAGNKIRIHKSCMEDIIVYDAETNEILLYLDLTWFTISAASGLINRVTME